MKPALKSLVERVAAGSLRVWLIAGILLHITKLRDAWRPLSLVYYTTPWPVIAAGLFVLALHARRLGVREGQERHGGDGGHVGIDAGSAPTGRRCAARRR